MGSPNFYTGTNLLNVGFVYEVAEEEQEDECSCAEDDATFLVNEIKTAFDSWLNDQGNLFFHTVEIEHGYHEGIQVYIQEAFEKRENFIKSTVDDWNKYKEFSGIDGYDVDLEDCPHFRSNIKNITAFELDLAIKREHKELHNALLEFAKEHGMGQVIGSSWTSSLSDTLVSKPMKRLC